jgi:hypothetical protein
MKRKREIKRDGVRKGKERKERVKEIIHIHLSLNL